MYHLVSYLIHPKVTQHGVMLMSFASLWHAWLDSWSRWLTAGFLVFPRCFLASWFKTNLDLIHASFKYFENRSHISLEFGQDVCCHPEVVYPKGYDVLFFHGLSCNGVINHQASFNRNGRRATATGYSVIETLAINHKAWWNFWCGFSEFGWWHSIQCFT